MNSITFISLFSLLLSPLISAVPTATPNSILTSIWSCTNLIAGNGTYSFNIAFSGSDFEPAFATLCRGVSGAGMLLECEDEDVSSEFQAVGEGEEEVKNVVVEHTWFTELGAHYWLTGNKTLVVEDGERGSFEIVPDRARAVA